MVVEEEEGEEENKVIFYGSKPGFSYPL